eukprot:UN4388
MQRVVMEPQGMSSPRPSIVLYHFLPQAIQNNVSVIPKSAQPARQRENMDIFDFKLSASDMSQIDRVPWRMAALPSPWDSCDAPDSIWSAGEAGFGDRVKQFIESKVAEFKLPI